MRHAVMTALAVLAAAVTAWTCGSSALAEPPDRPLGALPRLSGVYRNSSQHPHVFMAPGDLINLVARINSAGTFSARSFARLIGQVRIDLAARNEWERAYSGCRLNTYLYTFSYEHPEAAHDAGLLDRLRADTHVARDRPPPTGAAIVAARLALYAALAKSGATVPAGAPTADQAGALASRILLVWARSGFRDAKGRFLTSATQFCDDQDQFVHLAENAVALQIGRGVIFSVHAQDLLQAVGGLNAAEAGELAAFHAALFDLVRNASNFRFHLPELGRPQQTCELYSNHVGAALTGLLAIARLLDDGRRFDAVLYGTDRTLPLAIPWTRYFDHAIYGYADRPIQCYPNSGADSLTSHPSYQTSVVAPGEIEDRYRNANRLQGFGYTMGTLEHLFNAAEIMKQAGIDAFGYRGAHRQSIELAAQYYACFAKHVGFYQTVTGENARECADYQQYIGQLVNDVDTAILMGAYWFPDNAAITAVEVEARAAKAKASPLEALDPVRFGRWRN
jgi:hypothetical protein